jgi:hypothetical protein
MSDHFFHLFLLFIPILGIFFLLLKNSSLSKISAISFTTIFVFLMICIQSLPLHYWHANHFENSQKHDCCLPVPTVVSLIFNLEIPVSSQPNGYQLLGFNYHPQTRFSFNNRAPPIG